MTDAFDTAEDAVALGEQCAARGAPAERMRVQARMVSWALRAMPAHLRAKPPPGAVEAAMAAVERVAEGLPPDSAALPAFKDWCADQSVDWATRRAIDELSSAMDTVLRPADPDLAGTAEEIIVASGLWLWDEGLSECAEFGADQTEQEAVRNRVTREAHAALVAILKELEA